jgi:NAD(P)H-dependent FMN reductase
MVFPVGVKGISNFIEMTGASLMHIVILCGSNRKASNSERVSRFIAHRLHQDFPQESVTTTVIQPVEETLPLWNESFFQAGSPLQASWAPFSAQLEQADAFVFVLPEWNGMAPGGVKNFLQFCGTKELAHKPALLVGVSSGMGGLYPLVELRTNSFKNNKICYIPEQVVIREVSEVLLDFDLPVGEKDTYIRSRINFTLQVLLAYTKALKGMREVATLSHPLHPFGM